MHYRRWRVNGDTAATKKAANGAGHKAGDYIGHQVGGVKKMEHVMVVERILGKPLPPGAVVHLVNEIKTDNRPTNLVVCPDRAYHNLIHARMAAFEACGHYDWRKCRRCGSYDDLLNLRVYEKAPGQYAYWHRGCESKAAAANRRRKA